MAVFAIGDVQGCYDELVELLQRIDFRSDRDRLWFVGDLINRGPKSLQTLRLVRDLGDNAVTLLGNHDLHLFGVACGAVPPHKSDTLDEILRAPDRIDLLEWLRFRPLAHRDDELGYFMVHAGLHPQWSVGQALALAAEVEKVIRGEDSNSFFHAMYSDQPLTWHPALGGWDRLRSITDYLTRLRFCNASGDYLLAAKGRPGTQPEGYFPWYQVWRGDRQGYRVLFGHWAAQGRTQASEIYGLDTGCLWGGSLTALKLADPLVWFECGCPGYSALE